MDEEHTTVRKSDLDSVSLGNAAYLQLRSEIIGCRLAPGALLTERGIAATMGFGMSPVRDALIRLDQEGLVRTLPRRGYQVRPLTIKGVDDLFDFWAVLGPEVARYGVTRATDEQIDRILVGRDESVRLRQEQGNGPEVTRRTVEIIDEMFRILAEATRNEYMISSHARVSGELARVWTLVTGSGLLDIRELPAPEDDPWQAIYHGRDADRCAELARRTIQQSQNQVLRTLVRWPSVITTEVVPLPKATVR